MDYLTSLDRYADALVARDLDGLRLEILRLLDPALKVRSLPPREEDS
jgi:hypothetical protein